MSFETSASRIVVALFGLTVRVAPPSASSDRETEYRCSGSVECHRYTGLSGWVKQGVVQKMNSRGSTHFPPVREDTDFVSDIAPASSLAPRDEPPWRRARFYLATAHRGAESFWLSGMVGELNSLIVDSSPAFADSLGL